MSTKDHNTSPAALVTGAAVRIGKAITLDLAEMGYSIALHFNSSRAEAEKLCRSIEALGAACEIFKADLTNPNELENLIPTVKKIFPKLSLLVNNAAVFQKAPLKQTDRKLFDSHFDLNFKAPFFLSSDFARVCKKGQIINILDTRITRNRSSHFAYTLSKKALADFTRLAAAELAPLKNVFAVGGELLHAAVVLVNYVHVIGRVYGDPCGTV